MRHLCFILFLLLATPEMRADYWIYGTPSSWPAVLGANGYAQGQAGTAQLLILRDGFNVDANWVSLVSGGRYLILEGDNPVLDQFGFRRTGYTAKVRRVVDPRYTGQTMVWAAEESVPVVEPPKGARVFEYERWSNTPVMAGLQIGRGGVLWLATSPGDAGYEKYSYVPQALLDLGASPDLTARRVSAFFDYSYRSRADPDYMARFWRLEGIAQLHVGAWHHEEPDPVSDDFLRRLIAACHRNGILVYAWFELPHVSDLFWDRNPGCREKNALLQDALIFWRKNMNLLGQDCYSRASAAVLDVLNRFDWDGINLSELYFEGPRGFADLSETTPLSDDVRHEVEYSYGFDPAGLFDFTSPLYYPNNPAPTRQYLDYRADLQYRLHIRFFDLFTQLRQSKPGLGLTVTYLEDVIEPIWRDLVGADARRILGVQTKYDFAFLIEDPSSLWSLGPDRYRYIADQYRTITSRFDRLGVDINIVTRHALAFPTIQQTGVELAQLVNTVQGSFSQVLLYSEFSVLPPDFTVLPTANATVSQITRTGGRVSVETALGVGVHYPTPALVDGKLWPFLDDGVVWLPAGKHTIDAAQQAPLVRLLDFNGNLLDVSVADTTLRFHYNNTLRAIAVVDRQPRAIRLDGADSTITWQEYKGRYGMLLPPGDHNVEITAYATAGAPSANSNGLVSGATFTSGVPVSPGSIVSLFGNNLATSQALASVVPLPLLLGEAMVRVNGAAAPLLYVSPTQLNFQVPWSLSGWPQAPVTVTVGGTASAAQNFTFAAFSPGVFSTNQAGAGQGAILLANSSTVADSAHPASRGGYVSIFCTGLGAVTNTPATGSPALSSPLSTTLTAPTVTIGGLSAEVSFSGLAPGFVGLYQVNVKVPDGVAPGDSVPVVLSIGGFQSNGVTMAVR